MELEDRIRDIKACIKNVSTKEDLLNAAQKDLVESVKEFVEERTRADVVEAYYAHEMLSLVVNLEGMSYKEALEHALAIDRETDYLWEKVQEVPHVTFRYGEHYVYDNIPHHDPQLWCEEIGWEYREDPEKHIKTFGSVVQSLNSLSKSAEDLIQSINEEVLEYLIDLYPNTDIKLDHMNRRLNITFKEGDREEILEEAHKIHVLLDRIYLSTEKKVMMSVRFFIGEEEINPSDIILKEVEQ